MGIAYTCKGSLTTDLDVTEVLSTTAHIHENENGAIEVANSISTMKESLTANRGRPGQILADILHNSSAEARGAIGKLSSVPVRFFIYFNEHEIIVANGSIQQYAIFYHKVFKVDQFKKRIASVRRFY